MIQPPGRPEAALFHAVSPPVLSEGLRQQLALGEQRRRQGPRGRYAPSPTGPLHLGNLRTALLSWLVTRLQGGEWLLRIDDLDTPRNRPGAEERILADLAWLGLAWDGPLIRQSERRGLYAGVLSSLRRAGDLYPCRCSRRLLADISAPHGAAPVYPGFCRGLAPRWGPEQGRLPSWRLALEPGTLGWTERLARPGVLDASREVGDVVLRRADGFLAYHLATAVDELTLGITDVVRGLDLWAATGPQMAVMRRLGGTAPQFWHVPLWRDGTGQRLSKREGSGGLAPLRQAGRTPAEVVGLLAASVELVPEGSCLSALELLQETDLDSLRGQLARLAQQQSDAAEI